MICRIAVCESSEARTILCLLEHRTFDDVFEKQLPKALGFWEVTLQNKGNSKPDDVHDELWIF